MNNQTQLINQNEKYLIWIEENIKNKVKDDEDYSDRYENIKKLKSFVIELCGNVDEGFNKMISLKFKDVKVIVSEMFCKSLFEKLNNNVKNLCLIPRIIIYKKDENNNLKELDDFPFYNSKLIYSDLDSVISNLDYDLKKYFENFESFDFEYIRTKEDLYFPMSFNQLISEPSAEEIRKFNYFLNFTYKDSDENLRYLLNQSFKPKVPKIIIMKYWIRAYSFKVFSDEMNKDLKNKFVNKFRIYVRMLYTGLKKKYLQFKIDQPLYRGGITTEEELSLIHSYLQEKNKDLPSCICYSKVFLSFTTDKKMALQSLENNKNNLKEKENLVFYEIDKGTSIDEKDASNVNLKGISYFDKDEILFFPYSCFQVYYISPKKENNYYTIKLKYLGIFRKQIPEINKINLSEIKNLPKTKFTTSFLSSNTGDNKKVKIIIDNNPTIVTSEEKNKILGTQKKPEEKNEIANAPSKEIKNYDNYLLAKYKIEKKDLKEEIQIINCDKENEKDIKNSCIIFLDEKEIPFSFKYKFDKEGTYTFKFVFKKNINNLYKLFFECEKLIEINFDKFNLTEVENMSHMFKKCISLLEINLSNKKTKVSKMTQMFCECSNIKKINLSNFVHQLHDCTYMFQGCDNLIELNLDKVLISKKNTNIGDMFDFKSKKKCNAIISENETKEIWNEQ